MSVPTLTKEELEALRAQRYPFPDSPALIACPRCGKETTRYYVWRYGVCFDCRVETEDDDCDY